MEVFAEQGDPQYFKAAPTKDGEHIQIWNEPPSLETKEFKSSASGTHNSALIFGSRCGSINLSRKTR